MATTTTPFSVIYESFLSKVTDDMYMELTKEETADMLKELLLSAMHKFEFPRFNIFDYEDDEIIDETEEEYQGVESGYMPVPTFTVSPAHFNSALTHEEINILSTYMIVEWLGQQLASVENTRMKYSGSDFKFTSQANHMSKILTTKKDYEREGFHLQRLYKRRNINEQGQVVSTFDIIMKEN